jgi:hypothetical protein
MKLKIKYQLLLCSITFVISSNAQTSFKFDFGMGRGAMVPGWIQIDKDTKYADDKGYGFESTSDLTVGYNPKDKVNINDDHITSSKPFYFSVKLPEGNYNVKLILGDKFGTSSTTVKAECRRLMIEKVETKKGKFTTAEFTVHVKDSIIRSASGQAKVRLKPREINYFHWDNKLTL